MCWELNQIQGPLMKIKQDSRLEEFVETKLDFHGLIYRDNGCQNINITTRGGKMKVLNYRWVKMSLR